jgi:hypothetical protein
MYNSISVALSTTSYLYHRLDKAGVFNLTLLFFSFLVIYHIGRALIRKCKVTFSSSHEELAFSFALGLGVISYGTFFLGVFGLLYNWVFRGLVLILAIAFLKGILSSLKSLLHGVAQLRDHLKSKSFLHKSVFEFSLYLILLFYASIYLIAALAPEIEFDPLNYHLGTLKLYLSNHRIIYVPTNYCSNFPFAMEMIFLFGWLLKDAFLAKLFHYLAGLLVVVSIYSFAQRYFSSKVGLLAGVLFYTAPIVSAESKCALIDVGLAYMTFLAVYAFLNWYFTETDGWLYLSALFFGLAMSMKYTAINYMILVLPIMAYKCFRRPIKFRTWAEKIFVFLLISFFILSPWLIKNFIFTHNPVFPLLNAVFPNPFMSVELEDDIIQATRNFYYCFGERRLVNYLKLIWDITVVGKCTGMIGPLFLLFLPLILFMTKLGPVLRWLIFIGSASSVLWALQSVHARYLLPTLPLLSIPVAYAICSIKERAPFLRTGMAFIINVLVLALFVLQTPFLIMSWHRNWIFTLKEIPMSVVFGRTSREEYTSRYVTSLEAFRYINESLPKDARVFAINETYQFFTDRLLAEPNRSQMGRDLQEALSVGLSNPRLQTATLRITGNPAKIRWLRLKRAGPSLNCWFLHDVRVFEKKDTAGRSDEINRSQWKAASNHYSNRVAYAFDASPVTFWSTEQLPPYDSSILTSWSTKRQQRTGIYFLLDLGAFYEVEKVSCLLREPDCRAKYRLEFSTDNKTWQTADFTMTLEDYLPRDTLFRETLREFRKRGFSYIFVQEWSEGPDAITNRLQSQAKDSELRLLFNQNKNFLFEITVD